MEIVNLPVRFFFTILIIFQPHGVYKPHKKSHLTLRVKIVFTHGSTLGQKLMDIAKIEKFKMRHF